MQRRVKQMHVSKPIDLRSAAQITCKYPKNSFAFGEKRVDGNKGREVVAGRQSMLFLTKGNAL
jgi:hypothetical protein